jgi:hypothetical protein
MIYLEKNIKEKKYVHFEEKTDLEYEKTNLFVFSPIKMNKNNDTINIIEVNLNVKKNRKNKGLF